MVYEFKEGDFKRSEKHQIRHVMTEWERYTCFRFRPATTADQNVVVIQNGDGCKSNLGMTGGRQPLYLEEPGCRNQGLYLHEFGHAIGLVHEQQLPNRDDYIEIVYSNVKPDMRQWFDKYSTDFADQMGVPYEYSSIMHYGTTAFSFDDHSYTILTKDRSKMGEVGEIASKDLGYTDVEIVNKMYKCAEHCPDQNKCGAFGHLDQNCDCICRDGSITSKGCQEPAENGTQTGACQNNYNDWTCNVFASQGLCEKQSKYMLHNCAKACHVCQDWEALTCKDHYSTKTCETWKERGDCVTNREWMKHKCTKTCNRCPGVSRPEVECKNTYQKNKKCEVYALNGMCVINPTWMSNHCRKACQFCTIGKINGTEHFASCTNKHTNDTECNGWASQGYCVSSQTFMLPNCRRACDDCESHIVDLVRKCVNIYRDCDARKSYGQCTNNPGPVLDYCKLACDVCLDGTCKNVQPDDECEKMADEMQCLENAKWMEKNCAKACQTGDCGHVDTGKPGVYVKPSRYIELCFNQHQNDVTCDNRAKRGLCDDDPKAMFDLCKKSCGYCYTGECKNYYSSKYCDQWQKEGECESSSAWMGDYCQKSCGVGLCKGPGTDDLDDLVNNTSINATNDCVDLSEYCEYWAEGLECDHNPIYMNENCPKSCGKCGDGAKPTKDSLTCFDVDSTSDCEVAKDAGKCQSEPAHHLLNCRKTCGNCRGNCEDHDDNCAAWSELGECSSNPFWMLTRCQHSCNVCSGNRML